MTQIFKYRILCYFGGLSVVKYICIVKGLYLYSDSGGFVMGKILPFEDKNGMDRFFIVFSLDDSEEKMLFSGLKSPFLG